MSLPVYWQWDPTHNPEVRIVEVRSLVDPKALGWDPPAWRAAVRWACDQWEKTDVVAYVVDFEPGAEFGEPYPAGVLRVTSQDPAVVTPGKTWWGYQNPHIMADDPGVVQSADVWINKDCPPGWWQYALAHEFGHILGLDHRPYEDETCMASPARKFGPDELDLSSIREAYLGV